MFPFFELTINDDDDTGVDYNSFVDVPAHMKAFISFGNKKAIIYHFDKEAKGEQRMVTGVMISANTPIYRNDKDLGDHYVIFKSNTIESIRKKFMLEGRNHAVNKMHDMARVVDGAVMMDSYIIGGDNNPKAPEAFSKMNLQDGTWIAQYYIKDDTLWSEVQSGEFMGFSVEGYFDRTPIPVKNTKGEMKNQTKKGNMKKSIFERMFGKKDTFVSIEAVDGTVLEYDGELENGTAIFVLVDEERVPAPANDYQVTVGDDTVILTVDADGMVSAMETVADDTDLEAAKEEIRTEVEEALKAVLKDTDDRFKAIEAENVALKSANENMEKVIEDFAGDNGLKFKGAKKGAAGKVPMTYKELLAKANKKS